MPVLAKALRVEPVSFNDGVSLRIELRGYPLGKLDVGVFLSLIDFCQHVLLYVTAGACSDEVRKYGEKITMATSWNFVACAIMFLSPRFPTILSFEKATWE